MEKISSGIDQVVRNLLFLFAAIETVIIITAVVARYVFNSSFPWSEELARAILTWMVFLGASSAVRANELVAMESVRDGWSDRKVLATRVVTDIFVMIFLVLVIYASWRLISLTSRQTYPVTGYPLWIAYSAIPVSCVLMILHLVVRIRGLIAGRVPLRQEFHVDEIA
ncbi:TRAP transporter small permease [Rhizobium sp. GN54]|uniref:TRAP transporter small permease n=1 Tax=Rhizobium sp. GN54 TaxID=2898150 RepID=UPI001E48EECE|nr:TRAP transporter small permease [Rhizobium sp. GN54]MCD2183763.1 TRAP transporter small permease [Rhizobium sp. GN54]